MESSIRHRRGLVLDCGPAQAEMGIAFNLGADFASPPGIGKSLAEDEKARRSGL